MKNYIQSGDRLKFSISEAVASGQPVVVGTRVGVACGDIAAGDSGILEMKGVFSLPKKTGAITQGQPVYFDADGDPLGGTAGTGAVTTVASGNTPAGFAFEAAAETDTTIRVCLGLVHNTPVAHQADLANDANGTAIAASVNGLRDKLISLGLMESE
ncbi:MAG: DUF2190 family protein [Solidesulfovibrio sp. DCME]|uniref:DUF2190 family protein n=1 Tax=Solidesulfovibrio sp. DCME TaxID=3447380 RepID=UPI003D0FD5E1